MRKSIMLAVSLLITISVVQAQKPSGYNLKKGDKFSLTRINSVTTIQEAMGQSIETKQIETTIEDLEVTESTGDAFIIQVNTGRRKINISSPMMSQVMDSDLAGDQNKPFKMMTGKPFSFKMNKKGQILEVIGLDNMKAAMRKEMMSSAFAEATDDLLSVYAESAVKSILEAQFTFYNTGSGDTWTQKSSVVATNIPIELTNNLSWDNDKTILSQADIKLNSSTNLGGLDMKFVLAGDQKAIIDLDQKSGFPLKVQVLQELKGSMQAQGQDIPMTMTTETTTTIVKK